MGDEQDLGVIVASYVSSEEAKADLANLDTVFWEGKLAAYDAALVATDAWSQATIDSHTSRTSGDLDIGPVHDAFTVLFGGPFIGGEVHPQPPQDHRVRRDELLSLGNTLGPDSVIAVVLVRGAEYRVDGKLLDYRQAGIPDVFARAEWVATRGVDSTASHSRLKSTVTDLIEEGATENSRATKRE